MIWGMQFFLGLLVANAGEWCMHRYILHYCGKRPGSFWAYHWHEHHYAAWQSDMIDSGYKSWPVRWNTQAKEWLTLMIILLVHSPFFWWANGYAFGIYVSVFSYYILHRQAHLNSNWAKKYLPWHYDHHLYDSDSNWCVTYPLFDYVMKTRRKRDADL